MEVARESWRRENALSCEIEYDDLDPNSLMGFSGEIIFIMLLALLLFGPRKLPEIARTIGKFMAEFRRASSDFQSQIHSEIRKLELEEADPTKHLGPAMDEVKKVVDEADDVSISGALNRLTERIKNSVPQDYDA
jgi:TatA/E family protein of Tat protein translocase